MTTDQRQEALLAAADVLRTWVRTQRDGWHPAGSPLTVLPALGPAASIVAAVPDVAVAGVAAAELLSAVAVGQSPLPYAADAEVATARESRIGPVAVAAWRVVLATLGQLGRLVGAVAGQWRLAGAAVVALTLGYLILHYGAATLTMARARLSAAGKHVAVFDAEPAPAAESPAPKRGGGQGAARKSGRLQVDSNPPGAHVLVDGLEKGSTPLTIGDMAAGKHTIELRTDEGAVERSVVVTAGKTTQVNEAIFSGWVHVSSPIELEISEGTRLVRLDDSNQVLLPPGVHDLKFENRAYRFAEIRKVTVVPGDTVLLNVQPPRSRLSITASTPAEVLVDGTLVGGTPLKDFPLDVGTREVIVRNAAGAERRSTITVTVEPVNLAVDFAP